MHYQANFEFRDTEEGLRATETIGIGIGEDVYNALVESKVVEFQGKLFTWEDNASDGEHSAFVTMVETRPTAFGDFAGMAALSAPNPMTNPSTNPDTRLSDERLTEMLREVKVLEPSRSISMTRADVTDLCAALTELQALRTPPATDHFPGAGNMVAEPVFISRAFDPMTSHWFENQPLPNPPPSDWEVSEVEVEQAAKSICRLVPIDGSSAWIDPHGHVFPDEYSPREQATIRVIARAALQALKRGQP